MSPAPVPVDHFATSPSCAARAVVSLSAHNEAAQPIAEATSTRTPSGRLAPLAVSSSMMRGAWFARDRPRVPMPPPSPTATPTPPKRIIFAAKDRASSGAPPCLSMIPLPLSKTSCATLPKSIACIETVCLTQMLLLRQMPSRSLTGRLSRTCFFSAPRGCTSTSPILTSILPLANCGIRSKPTRRKLCPSWISPSMISWLRLPATKASGAGLARAARVITIRSKAHRALSRSSQAQTGPKTLRHRGRPKSSSPRLRTR